ncbi:MAG: hypothetical protein Q8J68_14575 [Methanolobus sp.]|uniref:hypothetical protein n=1 Tax=Methanolobus sp. TaxID=1874737 RepID=UPI00272F6531|nr:hypothetical protein [Methanolobus sp.]MDP2218499.1 hypothetical protein [Methanolobus sp.]
MDNIEAMLKTMDAVCETMDRPKKGETAKQEAKRLLMYLFRIPARVPEDYIADTIDKFVDLIIQAVLEEIEHGRKEPQIGFVIMPGVCGSDTGKGQPITRTTGGL